jgi:hypothetical protein
MRRLALAAAVLLATGGASPARPEPPPAVQALMAPAQQREVIQRLAALLDARYLDPQVGGRYAQRLRAELARGAYAGPSDPAAFGAKVTADLQAVSPDAHLRLAPAGAFRTPRAQGDTPASARPSGPDGLEDAHMIGDVAYLRFNLFPQEPASGAAARAFLLAHADARAVILDARPLRGGGPSVMDALLPLFYGRPTTLLRMDMRAAGQDDGPGPTVTMVRQAAPAGLLRLDHCVTPDPTEARLQATPLYYLTSHRTASAGEHLALALKRTGRAVLIGETTAGAGHFGWIEPLPHGFGVFIPVGRTYDPDTGTDWEGRGVMPDVPTTADAALDEALARIAAGPPHP